MTKKGEIKEWLSRIQYGSEIRQEFSIIFRDFDQYVELSFDEFMARRQIDTIPLHRITQIRQNMERTRESLFVIVMKLWILMGILILIT